METRTENSEKAEAPEKVNDMVKVGEDNARTLNRLAAFLNERSGGVYFRPKLISMALKLLAEDVGMPEDWNPVAADKVA